MTTALRARGLKRTCQAEACSVRFYDLNKTTIACPECGAAFIPPPPSEPRVYTSKPPSGRSYARNFAVVEQPTEDAPVADSEDGKDPAEETDDTVLDVDATPGDQSDAILELDIEVEDIEPIGPTENTPE
jgi:hypothetical protein